VIDPDEHAQHMEDLMARLARGEPVSAADVRAYRHEKVQFIDEGLSSVWQRYLVGDMTHAALRAATLELQAITRAECRFVHSHDWCAPMRDACVSVYALVYCFLVRLDACEALRH
jgi:hypothetical protein